MAELSVPLTRCIFRGRCRSALILPVAPGYPWKMNGTVRQEVSVIAQWPVVWHLSSTELSGQL